MRRGGRRGGSGCGSAEARRRAVIGAACSRARHAHAAMTARLLRSSLLRVHDIDEGIDDAIERTVRVRAATNADLAAGRLQQCALAGCALKEVHASQFKRCGACRTVAYCCREHQVEDWPSHKAACKAARKAAQTDEQE